MYSIVLMAAMTAGAEAPDFCWHKKCHGCWGCGCWSCHGCHGCWGCGCWGCHGCHCYGCHCYSCHCWGCHGCYGCHCCSCYGCHCYGCWSCHGCCACSCYSCYHAAPAVAPVIVEPATKPEVLPPPMKEAAKPDSTAKLIINVPADARLFIDDHQMKATSAERTFKTPQLDRSQTYYYDLRVEVVRDGKTITETKRVLLKAGEVVRASFSDLPSQEPAEAVAAK